jgi:hypothetical protein
MTKLDDDVVVVERVPGFVWDLRLKDESIPQETKSRTGLFSRILGRLRPVSR